MMTVTTIPIELDDIQGFALRGHGTRSRADARRSSDSSRAVRPSVAANAP